MATSVFLHSTVLRSFFVGTSLMLPPIAASAADTFHLSETEKAACTSDAQRLCASTYPDEQQLLVCMKANRASLGQTCLPVFDAGLKRRGL